MTIALTLKNRAAFVEGFIKNILKQNFNMKHVELCITDGGSTDGIKDVIKRYAGSFAQIKYALSDRSKLPFKVKYNPACDINAQVCNVVSFNKIIRTDAEIRFRNPNTLQMIFDHLDVKPECILTIPCARLKKDFTWSDDLALLPAVEQYADSIKTDDGFFCCAFTKSRFIETNGVDERFAQGFAGEDTHFLKWHMRNGKWTCATKDFLCYHLWHVEPMTPEAIKVRDEYTIPLLKKLLDENTIPNSHLKDGSWKRPEIISDRAIFNSSDGAPCASIIIPYRDTGGREMVLRSVISNLEIQTINNFEIILACEGGKAPGITTSLNMKVVEIKPISEADDVFCKSAAVNTGVKYAASKNIIMLDADILPFPEYIELVLGLMVAGYKFVQAGGALYKLSKVMSIKMMRSSNVIGAVLDSGIMDSVGHGVDNSFGRRYDKFPSGSFAITKEQFKAIGGLCEEYVGWGQEDLSFMDKVQHAVTPRIDTPAIPFIHLYHVAAKRRADGLNERIYADEKKLPGGTAQVIARDVKALVKKYGEM
jgi:glycosyltransferase involved in cell wall biosynthesis